jgi:hypothetical protein
VTGWPYDASGSRRCCQQRVECPQRRPALLAAFAATGVRRCYHRRAAFAATSVRCCSGGVRRCCHRGIRRSSHRLAELLPPRRPAAVAASDVHRCCSDVRRCCHRQATLLPAVSGGVRRCYHPCVALLQGDFGAARCSEPVRASPERRRSNEPRGLGEWASCRGADDGDRYSKGKAGISATNGGRWSC